MAMFEDSANPTDLNMNGLTMLLNRRSQKEAAGGHFTLPLAKLAKLEYFDWEFNNKNNRTVSICQ